MKQKLTKQTTGFTQIKNEVLHDPKLSLRAKGLFAYLYSKPDNWDFAAERIAQDSKDERKTVQNTLRELEAHGYLLRKKRPDGGINYTIRWDKNWGKTGDNRATEPQNPIKKTIPKVPKADFGTLAEKPNKINETDPKSQRGTLALISNKEKVIKNYHAAPSAARGNEKKEKKPNAHTAFIHYFKELTKKTRGITPIIGPADRSQIGRVMSKHKVRPETLEKLALFFLADPTFKKFTPSPKTFTSAGILTGLLNRTKNDPDFWRKLNGYIDRYQPGENMVEYKEQRSITADLRKLTEKLSAPKEEHPNDALRRATAQAREMTAR